MLYLSRNSVSLELTTPFYVSRNLIFNVNKQYEILRQELYISRNSNYRLDRLIPM